MIESTIAARRAIEALRAGVPNGDAVRALGSHQSEILAEFQASVAATSLEEGARRVVGRAGFLELTQLHHRGHDAEQTPMSASAGRCMIHPLGSHQLSLSSFSRL